MIERILRLAAAGSLLLALGACSLQQQLAATEVLNNGNCEGAETGLHRVTFADVARLRGSTLISMTQPQETASERSELLLFALSKGRQPTTGYQFRLIDARREDQVAELTFRWLEPAPDTVQAQVITSPCIIVGVERGSYSAVRAIDEDGNLLGELKI